MEFGKKIFVGNFVLMKKTRALSKREMKALRDLEKIPEDKRKILSRGTVPYIRVRDVGGGWSLEVSLEHTMFDALDALTIVRAGLGRLTVPVLFQYRSPLLPVLHSGCLFHCYHPHF